MKPFMRLLKRVRLLKRELKIAGINPVLLFLSVTAVFALLSVFGGELLRLSIIGFEVIFPVFAAIAVSEWGKTKADDNFDIIAAQSYSLFRWILCRFTVFFMETTVFALCAMILVWAVRKEMPVTEMLFLYLPTAFFLSTVSALFGICFSEEHAATLACGLLWLSALIARGLLRLPGVAYFYPFIRYAGDRDGAWLVSKAVLCVISLLLWGVIFQKTR